MASDAGILRNYHLTDGELALFANSLVLAMTRDLAELGTYSVTIMKIDDLSTLIDEFQAMPDDEILRTDLSFAAELRDMNKNAVLNPMRSIAVRAKAVFGENSAKYRSMNPGNLSQMTDSKLLIAARQVHLAADNNSVPLAVEGITAPYLSSFSAAIDAFEASITGVSNKKIVRDDSSEGKVLKGNVLYSLVVKYCDYGKTVWDGVSPAKYNDYIIYTAPSPGSLSVPSGLSFDIATKTLSWHAVQNATSYSLESSEDGVDFAVIYNGSDVNFIYEPIEGWMYYRVRARNDNGFSNYSSVLKQGYYINLPAPVNLAASIAAGTYTTINLIWDEVPSATNYKIYRSSVALWQPAGTFNYINQVSTNAFTEVVMQANRNYYHISCENSIQTSPLSEDFFIDTFGPPMP
jgi:hypothetical protein